MRQRSGRVLFLLVTAACLAGAGSAARSPQEPAPELVLPPAHHGQITGARFLPAGGQLLTVGRDGALTFWDSETWEPRRTLRTRPDGVADFALSPDGRTLAVTVREPGAPVIPPPGTTPLGPQGQVLIGPDDPRPPVRLDLWDLAAGRVERSFEVETGPLVFSPDGRLLLAGTELWDTVTGERARRFPMDPGEGVLAAAFSPDGSLLALLTSWRRENDSGAAVRLWNLAGDDPPRDLGGGSSAGGLDLAFSPDGRWLASLTGRTLLLWEAATGRLRWAEDAGGAMGMAFAREGSVIVTAEANLGGWPQRAWFTVRDAVTGRRLDEWSSPGYYVGTLSGSPDDRLLAAVVSIKEHAYHPYHTPIAYAVEVRDAAAGRLERLLGAPPPVIEGLEFSPDGNLLALGFIPRAAQPEEPLALWDLRSGALLHPPEAWAPFRFAPDGTALWARGPAGTLALLDPRSGLRLELLPDRVAQRGSVWVTPDGQPGAGPREVSAPTPDGERVAIAGDGGLRIADARTSETRAEIAFRGSFDAPAFSPDGSLLAASTSLPGAAGRYLPHVVVWDGRTGERLRLLEGVSQFAFSPDGRRLAGAAGTLLARAVQPAEVRVWRVETWETELALPYPDADAHAQVVAFSPDGSRLAVGTVDGRVELRRLPDGELLATLQLLPPVADEPPEEWVVHTPDGSYLGSDGAEARFRWRVGEELLPGEAFRERLHRPERVREALAGGG